MLVKRITAVWGAAMDFLIPVGYQDDSGFHYGEPTAPVDLTHHLSGL